MGGVIISQTNYLSIFKISPSQSPPQVFVSWWRLSRLHSSSSRHSVRHVRRRQDIFHSKCRIKNNDAQLSDVTNEEEDQEQLPGVASSCSIPVVPFNSGVIDPESLCLLTVDPHIECLFTTLPVLSKEEQNAKVAAPAHPAGLYALYASCFVGNMVEQLWMFVWPVAITLIHRSLLSVAVICFLTKFVIFVGGPTVGKIMDHFPRVPTYNCLSFVQASAQLLSVAMMIHAHTARLTIASSLLFCPWFVVLVLAGAVERLSGLALGVSMERDWVVLLAGANRPIALAEANVVISRIDLLCEIAGSSIFGILLSKFDPVTCLKLAAGFMLWTLPVVVVLSWLTNKLSSGVLDRTKSPQTCCRTINGGHFLDVRTRLDLGVDTVKHGWVEYMQQPVFLASMAYVFLCFNVVLTPGGLLTAFLTQRGLDPSIIGGFSGSCAFMGIAATFVSTSLVTHFGILKIAAAGLILQAFLLTVAVAVYCTGSLSKPAPLFFFLCLIVLSRLGHMTYDVVGAQILQTGIPTSKANVIGMTEVSVANLAELVMLGVAIIANETSHFGLLAMLSLLSVVGAACLFCIWLMNLADEQRSLFSLHQRF